MLGGSFSGGCEDIWVAVLAGGGIWVAALNKYWRASPVSILASWPDELRPGLSQEASCLLISSVLIVFNCILVVCQ